MAGRPTEYNADIQAKAEAYAEGGYEACNDVVPSYAGLASYLRVSRQTLYNWGDKNPEFMDTLKDIESEQEKLALSGGLRGDYNPTITKLLLANHGYSDKLQQDHTSTDGSMSPKPTIIELVGPNEQSED